MSHARQATPPPARRGPSIVSIAAVAALTAALALPGCGDDRGGPGPDAGPVDAGIDASDDPFATMFDSPDDFPRTGCRAGSLAGFAETGFFPQLGLRLAQDDGALVTYVSAFLDEIVAPHTVTADDLIIRDSYFSPFTGRWTLSVIHVCDVPAPGVLRGHQAFCFDDHCSSVFRAEDERFHRLAGEAEGDGLTLLGERALPRFDAEGVALNVRAEGDVAYLAMGSGGLRTVSVADPRAPALLGYFQPAARNYYNDIKLLTVGGRRYAILAGAPSAVVDVTVPASPQLVAELPVSAHTLALEGTTAYLVDGARPTLSIYDLADPRAPVRRAMWTAPGLPGGGFHDLHVVDGIAYLSTYGYGITIADVHDPATPRLLGASPFDVDGRYWHSPWAITIGGRKLVLNGDEGGSPNLRVLDADPMSPTFLGTVGTWSIPGPISMHNLMARGDKAYLAHYQHGIRVLDLADPTAPRPIGYFNTWREPDATAAYYGSAIGLDLDPARRRIYVADTRRGLLVLQATAALMP